MDRRSSGRIVAGVRRGGVVFATACALAACATPGTTCPGGTALARRIYSGGAETEWCRRPDGARQGPERRYYESGVELASGEYVDGAQSGVWRYRFNDGRNWRAERWEDGALVQATIDPAVAHLSPDALAELGPTTSGIIKLASHDPLPGSETRAAPGATFVSRFQNGRPQVAGSYDLLGLRTGTWRFWYQDGRPAREIEFLGGVRERAAREWHPNGTLAAEGGYVAGMRDGRWRFWDERGQLTAEAVYRDGARLSAPATGGMLPLSP